MAQAKYSEIMSWDDWKAKARSLQPRCSECGTTPKPAERQILAITGKCEACTAKTNGGNWRELCKSS